MEDKTADERPAVQGTYPPFEGMITRQTHPQNLEFPFATLHSFLTPNEQFYVRTHFEVPELLARTWSLHIEGHVEKPYALSYDALRQLPACTLTALLECSGNSRVFLKPPQVSIRWEQGGVSNAEWTGVPLALLLDRAGVKPGAVEVILEGYDTGQYEPPEPQTPGSICYARSMPLEKARQPEVLLAYQMNGADLPPAHGYPVRAVVAGWYGMASVKWLRRIIVTDRPFHGYFQTFLYSLWDRHHGIPTLVPVTDVQVKAEMARPALHAVVPKQSTYRMIGAAWGGASEIARVEVSTDGGQTWAPARLDDTSVPFAWRFWEYDWETPAQPAQVVVMARATDALGQVQPMQRDHDRRDAVINQVQPIEVYVR